MLSEKGISLDSEQLKFRHPCAVNLVAPSGAGKTYLLRKILQNYKETTTIESIKVLWAYGIKQDLHDEPIPGVPVDYFSGLPTESDLDGYNVCVLDDLSREISNSDEICNFFTRTSHHKKVSIFYLTQNVFGKGKVTRDISLNIHYFVLMKTRRDIGQIEVLARQMFGKKAKGVMEAYLDATEKKFGYLVIDIRADSDEAVRVRTDILPGEGLNKFISISTPILYIIK
jgi:hypothetical protein